MTRACFAVALLALASVACVARAAPADSIVRPRLDATEQRATVRIERDGEAFDVSAEAVAAAPRAIAWAVLTDYDHLADFVPDMVDSRVLYRDGSNATVAQRGRVGLLFFEREFALTLDVTEQAFDRIDTVQVAGSFRAFQARYTLENAAGDRTRVAYAARFEPLPAFAPPPLIGIVVMRMNVRRQFEAVVREMVRRANAAAAAGDSTRR